MSIGLITLDMMHLCCTSQTLLLDEGIPFVTAQE
jgi:hypothetical protein